MRGALLDLLKTPGAAAERRILRSENRQAVGYIGWIGHGNLGDDAMFRVIRDSLECNEPLIPFISPECEEILARRKLGGVALFRAGILGGGTLIHQYLLPAVRMIHRSRIPLYTVGTGVGSPGFFAPNTITLSGWKDILQDCRMVSVRGPLSLQMLQELGVDHAEVIGDPALGLTGASAPPFRSRQRLIINLAQERQPIPGSSEHAMLAQVAKLANDFREKGGELVGIALGGGDYQTLKRFMRNHRVSRMRIEDHRHSRPMAVLETIAGSIGLIGVRLHSAVLASCVGVPSVLFAYRDKCNDFMASMGLSEFAVEVSMDRGPREIERCFHKLQSEPAPGPAIYQTAVGWKNRQADFYTRLAKDISVL